MDQELRDRLAAFADLEDGPLADLIAEVEAAYASIRAGENARAELATLTELADSRTYLQAVQTERAAAAAQAAQEEADRVAAEEAALAALDAQFSDDANGDDEEPEEEEESTADQPAEGGDDDSGDEAPSEEDASTPVPAAAAVVTPSAAAAGRHVPANRQPRPRQPERVGRVVSLAGGAIGNPLDGLAEIGAAVARQARNFIGGSGGGGYAEKVPVARIIADYPEERRLGATAGHAEANQAKIEAVGAGGPTPLAAAGGICIPPQPYYDSAVVATDARPVVAALQPFQTRGGVAFIPPTSVADYTVNEWTLAQDEAVTDTEGTWKTVQRIECGDVTTVRPHAVVGIWEFGNLNEMTNPERTSAEMTNAMAAYARKGDELLLRDVRDGSLRLTHGGVGGQVIGAARDTLVAMGQAATAYRNRFRMDPAITLNVLPPAWLRDAIQLDLAVQQPGDDAFVRALAEINGYLAAINVRPYWYLDSPAVGAGGVTGPSQYFAAPTQGGAVPSFPNYAQWAIFHDGAWLYGDQGEIELGPIRDSVLNRRNAYQMFVEGFELAAMVGVASWWVTTPIAIAGGFGAGEDLGS